MCWCPAKEEGGRSGWWRVVTYQLLLKSVNQQMKLPDMWAIFKTKQNKKKSELPSGKWEEDTTWQKCFRKHRQTQKHTQIHQCVHTHTRTKRQLPQTDKTSKLSLLLSSFSNSLRLKGSWETSCRELVGTEKLESLGSPIADSLPDFKQTTC